MILLGIIAAIINDLTKSFGIKKLPGTNVAMLWSSKGLIRDFREHGSVPQSVVIRSQSVEGRWLPQGR